MNANLSPAAALITAGSDASVTTENLVRGLILLAKARRDEPLTKWCELEVSGYDVEPWETFPKYRVVPITLMGKDHLGREVPVYPPPNPPKHLMDCAAYMGLGELQRLVNLNRSIKAMFVPEQAAVLRQVYPGAV